MSSDAIKKVQVGDKVTTVFDGEVVAIDNELGKITLRGNTRGAQHIDWEVDVHWATEFYEGRPAVGQGKIADDEAPQPVAHAACPDCGEEVPIYLAPLRFEVDDDGQQVAFADVQMDDVWAHAWTHDHDGPV